MDVRAEINYSNSSPERAFALSMDPAFRSAVCEATHATSYDVDIREDDSGGASVTITRTVPADLPDIARKIIGDIVEVMQVEHWSAPGRDGQRTAELIISIKGQPAQMVGSVSLEPFADGSRMRIVGDVKVRIPFVGRKIAAELAKAIVAAAAAEERTGLSWLGR